MLTINNLSKSFLGRVIFKDITYNFPTGKIIALIGTNGAGKTTLLNILCGLDETDSGSINKAKTTAIGYLPQEPNPTPETTILLESMAGKDELYKIRREFNDICAELEHDYSFEKYEQFERLEHSYRDMGGYSFEHDSSKILYGLGFKEAQLQEHPNSLSGGWRMRLELAKLLNKQPSLLILDEPTNHLDLPAIEWLEVYLQNFSGTTLFVSHDESLLNRLPEIILHLKNSELNEYYGNYQDFLMQYELKEAGKTAELKNLQQKITSASRFVERFKAKSSKATQARSRMKMITRLQEDASNITLDKSDAEINIKIPLKEKSGKDVLRLEDCVIGYNKPLMRKISCSVQRGQKIAIVGANGLGKSTLLKTIINQVPLLSGEIKIGHNVHHAYYAQNQAEFLELNKNVFSNLLNANSKLSELNARRLLGSFLFKGDDIYKEVRVLSGGEKSRLSLACLLVQDANLLLLDEPTNHLDMLSTEILTEALVNYEGTVMLVSHNRSFINAVATHILIFGANNEVYLSKGNLEELDTKWLS